MSPKTSTIYFVQYKVAVCKNMMVELHVEKVCWSLITPKWKNNEKSAPINIHRSSTFYAATQKAFSVCMLKHLIELHIKFVGWRLYTLLSYRKNVHLQDWKYCCSWQCFFITKGPVVLMNVKKEVMKSLHIVCIKRTIIL